MNLRHYIAVLQRWWWVVVLMTAVAVAAGYVASLFLGPEYKATTTLYVSHASSSSSDVTAARMLTRTYVELVTARPVLEDAIARLGLQLRPEDLEEKLAVNSPRETQLISIEAADRDPVVAAGIANAVGDAFIAWIGTQQSLTSDLVIRNLDDRVSEVLAQIDTITADITALRTMDGAPSPEINAQINALEVQLRQQQTSYAELVDVQIRLQYTPQANVMVTARAQPADMPEGPGMLLLMLFAGGIGLGGALTLIGFMTRFNGRVEVLSDLRGSQAPAFAEIPRASRPGIVELTNGPTTALGEAIYGLRTRLHLAGVDTNGTVLAVIGSHNGQGNALIAANLAVALAQSGQRVVLIDGHVRMPFLQKLFGATGTYGLLELLKMSAMHPSKALIATQTPNLQLLVATTRHGGDMHAMLDRTRLNDIIAELKNLADIIIVDVPALDATGDGLLLSSCANYALFVAEIGRTRSRDLVRIEQEMDSIRVPLLGSVLYGHAGRRVLSGTAVSADSDVPMASGGAPQVRPQ